MAGTAEYYVVVKKMMELNYYWVDKIVLFKCDWFNMNKRKSEIKVEPLDTNNSYQWPYVLVLQVIFIFLLAQSSTREVKVTTPESLSSQSTPNEHCDANIGSTKPC